MNISMTKEELCLAIIEDFKICEGKKEVVDSDVILSSTLAVAMEYLGLIVDPEMQQYASGRAGIIYIWDLGLGRGPLVFSLRDLLSLLKEKK